MALGEDKLGARTKVRRQEDMDDAEEGFSSQRKERLYEGGYRRLATDPVVGLDL